MSEQTEQVVAPAPETPGASNNKSQSLWVVVVIVLVAIAALVAYRFGYFGSYDGGNNNDSSTIDTGAVVATVNGVAITRAELDEKLNQIRGSTPEGAIDPTQDASFEIDILEEMISLAVLLQRADAQNIAASDEQVQVEIQKLVELFGGQESFESQLALAGLTQNQFADNMKNELRIRQLINTETNIESIEVTDEETRAAYDLAIAQNPANTNTFEEVSEILRDQLIQQKSAAVVNAYISDIRSETTVVNYLTTPATEE